MEGGRFLTFEIANQPYAVSIDCIKEILNGCGSISIVPEFPEYGRGVVNLRGDIVPIIDVRVRLHMPPLRGTDQICVIVTECSDTTVSKYLGFVVDSLRTVTEFDGQYIAPAPSISAASRTYVKGIYNGGEGITLILDPEKMLTEDMAAAIGSYMEKQK